MPEQEPVPVSYEYYMIDSAGHETSVFLSQQYITSDQGERARLNAQEHTFMSLLLQNEDIPFKLSEVRSALGKKGKDTKVVDVCLSVLTKAPFLEGHLVAVVSGKTQFYGFLPECRNTKRFYDNFQYKLQNEFELFTTNDGPEFTNKEKQRRHAKITKVVETALGATVAVSALIGYKYYKGRSN